MPHPMLNTQTLAGELSRAFQTGQTISPAATDFPVTLEQAEAVQDAMVASLGPVGAWKLGATHHTGLAKMNIPRFFCGALPVSRLAVGGGTVKGNWQNTVGVECEYAFRFSRDIEPGADISVEAVRQSIAAVHAAFEIPGTRYSGKLGCHGGFANIADDGLSGWLVVGEEIARSDFDSLADRPVRLVVDGEVACEGTAGQRIDDFAYPLLAKFAELATGRGYTIRAGQFVVTGSCNGYTQVPLGVPVKGDFGGLGQVDAVFVGSEGN